ncbi:DUF4184 family protein [Nocardia sp. NPDC051030]|uniref:DUF4184 family protein n=1 Tax=Nocardia sp. NPDC051030 TaxID=3155162 RepID=UPI00343D7DAA
MAFLNSQFYGRFVDHLGDIAVPFTLAHPAVTLPLRRWLWFPGLVAGSIAPDVGYYLPIGPDGELTHSLSGLPVDLLLGAMLLAVDRVARRPAMALIGRTSVASWPGIWRASVAILVGVLTHLFWDSFTHTDGFAVRHWEVLRLAVIGPHRVYNVIGYLSSAAGMLILGWYAARWYRRTAPVSPAPQRNWVLTALLLAATAGALVARTDPVSDISLYDCVRHMLVGGIQSAGIAFALYAVASALQSKTL